MSVSHAGRHGAVLIIVAGLAAMLLSIATVFLVRMRSDAQDTTQVAMDAQARIMLLAGLQYLQESSRLGWAPAAAVGDATGFDHEAFGWTDIRDGSPGPRGPRQTDGTLPVPAWWGGKNLNDDDTDQTNAYRELTDADLPSSRRWPCMGSTVRVEAFAYRQTPYAIRQTMAPNPWVIPENDTTWDGYIQLPPPTGSSGGIDWSAYNTQNRQKWQPYVDYMAQVGVGRLDPQPIADNFTDFARGDTTVRTSSTGLGWFRVYRETPSDRDGQPAILGSPPNPWYDTVPMSGHGTFIITAGAGGTRGFRFWSTADPGYDADLEPITAEASGLFADEAMFREMQRQQVVLWYRAEWTAHTGGTVHTTVQYISQATNDNDTYRGPIAALASTDSGGGQQHGLITQGLSLSNFGAWKWIQRLEREPPKW